jgi:Hydrazine synthase alpha subunit middle domain
MPETRVIQSTRLLAIAALVLFVLTACGGGGGGSGGGVTLVSGDQDADPVVLEIPIAYVRRPIPEAASDLRNPLAFNPGAELYVRERAATTADDIDVTSRIAGIVAQEIEVDADTLAIDIKGLESSFDGKQLVFAARVVPEPVAANLDNTTWNLWLFDMESGQASYLIPSRIKRNEGMEAGGAQDIAPHFMPDDRVVFSSTRQIASQARQLNDGRAQLFAALDEDRNSPAAVLHIYDPQRRGDEFQQLSFNLSHDIDPTVLSSGEIVFSRWNNTTGNHISLFSMLPSGSGLAPLYGFHSRNSGTEGAAIAFTQPRELDDGRIASLVHNFQPTSLGGEIILINQQDYSDYQQGLWHNRGATGPGHESLTDTEVRSDDLISAGGQYGSLYPLRDGTGRLLVTWSECRVVDEDTNLVEGTPATPGDLLPCSLQPDNTDQAPPLYGAWVYDPGADTQRPVVLAREGFWVSEVIAAENRDYPDLGSQPQGYNPELAAAGQGQLKISSVYDLDGSDISPAGIPNHARPGTAAFRDRPARFLRFVQPVPLPDPDVFEIPRYALGLGASSGFREILGYAPVEPDGSVTVNIPAQRAFNFDVLDERGRRIGARHRYWLQLGAGEIVQCTGCHDHATGLPHGRSDSAPIAANPGARALDSGILGYPATDSETLFASFSGQSMADTWDEHMPADNPGAPARELDPAPRHRDAWSGPDISPETDILDRDYDPAWTDIPPERAIIVRNFDSGPVGRIVINYPDHIQPIWERIRPPVIDAEGNEVENCVGCHSTDGDSLVPAGQLDLTTLPSDQEPEHYRSYRELLSGDAEQWIDAAGALADRLRVCITFDADGNELNSTEAVPVSATARAGSANGSERFFNCFEGGVCGPTDTPPLPDNCTEDAGEPVPATRNTVEHNGMLSESELHLISEWLDIGGQYFNNPFDPRLAD